MPILKERDEPALKELINSFYAAGASATKLTTTLSK